MAADGDDDPGSVDSVLETFAMASFCRQTSPKGCFTSGARLRNATLRQPQELKACFLLVCPLVKFVRSGAGWYVRSTGGTVASSPRQLPRQEDSASSCEPISWNGTMSVTYLRTAEAPLLLLRPDDAGGLYLPIELDRDLDA